MVLTFTNKNVGAPILLVGFNIYQQQTKEPLSYWLAQIFPQHSPANSYVLFLLFGTNTVCSYG